MITAAQAWYVARVYPEHVTDKEVRDQFDAEVTSEADRTYWEAAARMLQDMASNETHTSRSIKKRRMVSRRACSAAYGCSE